MTVVHTLDSSGSEARTPSASPHPGGTSGARSPRSMRPVDMGPKPPAWSRSTPLRARSQSWVAITLFVAVGGLLAFIATAPRPARMHAWVEAERPLIELRLSLAELRAIISDYHIEHGAYPGCDTNGGANPRWFEREWSRAIERANAVSDVGLVRLHASDAPGGVPRNPVNGLASVRFLAAAEAWPERADDSTGWIYKPATGEIRANCTGNAFGFGPEFWDL